MIISDDEFCVDCGSNADVYIDDEPLCQSCANVYLDNDDEWEDVHA
jgi:hypothetical protein